MFAWLFIDLFCVEGDKFVASAVFQVASMVARGPTSIGQVAVFLFEFQKCIDALTTGEGPAGWRGGFRKVIDFVDLRSLSMPDFRQLRGAPVAM